MTKNTDRELGEIRTELKLMREDVKELQITQKDLLKLINHGKGGVRAILAIGGVIVTLISVYIGFKMK